MIRMVSLYALRYEKHSSNDVGGLLNMLSRRGVSEPLKKVRRLRAVWFPNSYKRTVSRSSRFKFSFDVIELSKQIRS